MFEKYQEPNEMFFAQVKEDGSFILLKRKVNGLDFGSITLKNGFSEPLCGLDYQYFVNLNDACNYIRNKLLTICTLQKKIINNCNTIPYCQYEFGTWSNISMYRITVWLDEKVRITKERVRTYDELTVILCDGTKVPRETSDTIYCLDENTATQIIQTKRKIIADAATFVLSNCDNTIKQCEPRNYKDLVAY